MRHFKGELGVCRVYSYDAMFKALDLEFGSGSGRGKVLRLGTVDGCCPVKEANM